MFLFVLAIEIGTVLTAVTANDVDTNPALTYSFSPDSEENIINMFSIDRFSGKVILSKCLDYEMQQEYHLKITASDTAHSAHTMLTIRITDVNDNLPVFQQPAYHALLPGKFTLNTYHTYLIIKRSIINWPKNFKYFFSVHGVKIPRKLINLINFSENYFILVELKDFGFLINDYIF